MKVPVKAVSIDAHVRQLADAINANDDGKTSNTGNVTLSASTASTTVTDRRVGISTVVTFMPTTGNAAAELGNGTMFVPSTGNGEFDITHASNAQTDRTFRYEVTG